MSSGMYVKQAIADVERELEQIGEALPARCATPLSQGYCPEVDTMPTKLDDKRANYFQGLIGIVRWMW